MQIGHASHDYLAQNNDPEAEVVAGGRNLKIKKLFILWPLTGDNMNEYTPKKNSINDVITEKKQLDGDEIIIQKKIKTILRVSVPFEYETHAIELIANYYTKDHPYFCDIKELCGKELLT